MAYGRGIHKKRLVAALAALAFGGACDTTSAEDAAKARAARNLQEECEDRPPFVPHFEPALQWAWTGSSTLPEFNQVMMTPAVADVNQDGTPDVIFSSFRDVPEDDVDWREGVLRAISGDDGRDLWAVTDPAHRIKAAASIALGDIDGDGKVEICGIPSNGRGIICYENDGTFKFRSAEDAFDYNEWGGPSLADLDGDGTVEILDGNRVYSNTGALKWVGTDGMGGAQYTGPVSFAADIDGDGTQEVINGRSVYRADGSLKCANTTIESGLSAVGNFDGDTKGEIVVAGHGKVSLLDDNCALLWTKDIPGGCSNGCGGGPTLADVDHDGLPEIGVVGDNAFSVLESDGSVKWSSPIQDWSSGKSGATAFDFEDDGNMELVFADEVSLRIYNGATGAVRFQTRHSSGTTHENPVIADVDGDFAADLIVATNDLAYPPYHGIRVYHDTQEGWAHTRRIWNQHAYSVTNVNEDGSIPAHPVSHWQKPRLNTFRSNVAGDFSCSPPPPPPENEPPVAICQNITVSADAQCQASASVNNGSHDPDGQPGPLSVSESPAGPFGLGSHYVTLTANDGEDSAQCVGAVTVVDTTKPTVSCSASQTIESCSPNGTAVYFQASAADNCGEAPVTCSHDSGATFPVGQTAVTCSATDGSENTASCAFNVTVRGDTTPPVISCPISVDASISLGQISIAVDFHVSASDTCGPAQVTCSHPPGSLFIPGLTPVTCTAKDGSGNSASCQFGVRVSLDLSLP
ncbi:HYR domain-containing protein [Hyalangium gracile]|uniref:HYR domain-containing protein n=1 Tax=Hyalangium gracile TaxID=394092 RepID=UPI001CCDAB91|nr:HYR domain-containing protein [Hyalangium gracile]